MILVTAPLADGRYDLIIVMEDSNIARIKEHDPAAIPLAGFDMTKLRALHIAYGSPDEMKILTTAKPSFAQVQKMLFAGWRFRPEQGDSDQIDQGMQRLFEN